RARKRPTTARQRQRAADETGKLHEAPPGPAHPRVEDFAGIDRRLPAGQAITEAAPDCERQRGPVLRAHQLAEARVLRLGAWFGPRRKPRLEYRLAGGREGDGGHTRRTPCRYFFASPSRPTTRVPRRISAASLGLGTVSICACQRSSASTKVRRSCRRLLAMGCSFGSRSASATQALSAATAGSI